MRTQMNELRTFEGRCFDMEIMVSEIVGADSYSPVTGRRLGNTIAGASENVVLNFNNVSPFTSLFFNAMFASLQDLSDIRSQKDGFSFGNILVQNQGLEGTDYETYTRCLENVIAKNR